MDRELSAEALTAILERVVADARSFLGLGKVASYIPALAQADPMKLGMAVTTVDGVQAAAGDAAERFSIQSIAKVFALKVALDRVGIDLWERVGREPSGDPFNSLVQLEYEHGIPRNPLINAGALVVADVVVAHAENEQPIDDVLDFVRKAANDATIAVDEEVAASERATGLRNESLAALIKSFGNLENTVEAVLDTYCRLCAVAMSCEELSRAMLFLAAGGSDPLSGHNFISPERARRINSIMLTCGHYDASGDFAFRVGFPAKSGVGGGIAAVVPGRMGVAVWSPALSPQGNSLAGTRALELFAVETGFSVFG